MHFQDENNISEVECIECSALIPMSHLKKHISEEHGVERNPVKVSKF